MGLILGQSIQFTRDISCFVIFFIVIIAFKAGLAKGCGALVHSMCA